MLFARVIRGHDTVINHSKEAQIPLTDTWSPPPDRCHSLKETWEAEDVDTATAFHAFESNVFTLIGDHDRVAAPWSSRLALQWKSMCQIVTFRNGLAR